MCVYVLVVIYPSLDLQFDKCLLLYVQSRTPDDGWKDRPKHVQCHFEIK